MPLIYLFLVLISQQIITIMNLEAKKTYITSAVRSRFMFSSPEEAERFLGMQLKSWVEKFDESQIRETYNRFSTLCEQDTSLTLKEAIDMLTETSEVFLNEDFQDSKRSSTLQKLGLKLFFWTYFSTEHGLYDILSKEAKPSEEEIAIFEEMGFRAEGYNEGALDTMMFMLLCFNAVKPFTINSRPRKQSSDNIESTKDYLGLLTKIKQLWPMIGNLESFPEFDEAIKETQERVNSGNPLTSARMWALLTSIVLLKELRHLPSELTRANEQADYAIDFGIWIDNQDMGRNRFWIFPTNLRMVFCYSNEYGKWVLRPYEWISTYDEESGKYSVHIIPPEESLSIVKYGQLDASEVATVKAEYEGVSDEYQETMYLEILTPDKSWLDFDILHRLKPGSRLNENYSVLLKSFYNQGRSGDSVLNNPYSVLIDTPICFVGMDNKYLYVMDLREVAHRMVRSQEVEDYEYVATNVPADTTLFDILKSGEVLYRIPHTEKGFEATDANMQFSKLLSKLLNTNLAAVSKSFNRSQDFDVWTRKEIETYRRFKEAALATRFPAGIRMYHVKEGKGELRRLCFNNAGLTVDFDTALLLYGASEIKD